MAVDVVAFDFRHHFWGEKHNGFNILLQNSTRNSSNTVRDLTEFFKERLVFEEEYHKNLSRFTSRPHGANTFNSFAPIWIVIKTLVEKLHKNHVDFLQKLQDAYKESLKYADEHHKLQKQLRDGELKTLEIVNLMQTTTTCLQKCKETYHTRCQDHEKLKKENASLKDLQKSDSKVKKSREEYKQYVDKYAKIRDQFEEKMLVCCENFQRFETQHLIQMKRLLIEYFEPFEQFHDQSNRLLNQFKCNVERLNNDELLSTFVNNKGTGLERPRVMPFEEPDLVTITHGNGGEASKNWIVGDLLDLDDHVTAQNQMQEDVDTNVVPSASVSQPTPLSNTVSSSTGKKMALWLPGKILKSSKSSSIKTPVDDPFSDQTIRRLSSSGGLVTADQSLTSTSTAGSIGGSFLKKVIQLPNVDLFGGGGGTGVVGSKTKNQNQQPGVTTTSVDQFMPQRIMDINQQQSIVPSTWDDFDRKFADRRSSSSDESDDESSNVKKLTFKINDQLPVTTAASIDQLCDVVKEMDFSTLKMSSLNNNDWSSTNGRSGLLRAAKTGDDKFNLNSFAAGIRSISTSTSAVTRNMSKSNTHHQLINNGDSNVVVFRPRSSTPSALLYNEAHQPDFESPAFEYPLAAALTETIHALFKGPEGSNCAVKVYGSLTLSFPAQVINNLCKRFIETDRNNAGDNDKDNFEGCSIPQLAVELTNAERVKAIVPNSQLLPNQSSFSASSRHQLHFDMRALIDCLKRRRQLSPHGQFYNVDVLRYEVSTRRPLNHNDNVDRDLCGTMPIRLRSFWKRSNDAALVDVVVQYAVASKSAVDVKPFAVTLLTSVDGPGPILKTQLKPDNDASWEADSRRLVWTVGPLTLLQNDALMMSIDGGRRKNDGNNDDEVDDSAVRHDDDTTSSSSSSSYRSLKARFTTTGGCDTLTPAPTQAQFQIDDFLCSNLAIRASYRLSLVKCKVVSGKYLCEPEIRSS